MKTEEKTLESNFFTVHQLETAQARLRQSIAAWSEFKLTSCYVSAREDKTLLFLVMLRIGKNGFLKGVACGVPVDDVIKNPSDAARTIDAQAHKALNEMPHEDKPA